MENIVIIPDKQISNNFSKYESIFLKYGAREITYTSMIPYREMRQGRYYAFYVLDGKMSLHISGMNGEERITAVLQRGSFYTMYSDSRNIIELDSFFGEPAPSVRMLAFTREEMFHILIENPEIAEDVIRFYEDLVVMLQCELKDVLFYDGRKRVCNHLIQCYRACGSTELVTTQEMIGKHIGLDRTNVAKYLSELRNMDMIQTKRNRVVLLDVDAIRSMSEY